MSLDLQDREGSPAHSTTRLLKTKTQPRGLLDHPDPLGLHPINQQRSSTRRISASFTTDGPPSCLPVVATSSLTASTTHGELPMICATARRPTRKVTPTNIPLLTASTVTTYESAGGKYPYNNENIPPGVSSSGLQHKHKNSIDIATAKLRGKSVLRPTGTLAKSNTLGAISNLTASISRSSLTRFSRSTSISSTAESESRTSIASASSAALPSIDTGNPRQVHVAQSSAYWTGRYMTLQDRFRNEMLLPVNMTTLITAHAERSTVAELKLQAPNRMSLSTSHPNLMHGTSRGKRIQSAIATASNPACQVARGSPDAVRLEDEDDRASRVFSHLEALCTTSEARKSLHTWQQTYARRVGKAELLPRGGTMEDKGWVERLLRRGSHNTGKRATHPGTVFG